MGQFWKRPGKKKILFFCSLECNVKILEGNKKSNKPAVERKQIALLEMAKAALPKPKPKKLELE